MENIKMKRYRADYRHLDSDGKLTPCVSDRMLPTTTITFVAVSDEKAIGIAGNEKIEELKANSLAKSYGLLRVTDLSNEDNGNLRCVYQTELLKRIDTAALAEIQSD